LFLANRNSERFGNAGDFNEVSIKIVGEMMEMEGAGLQL
jgi:hypothetical protein